jgi:hypothetical protein
MTFKSGNDIKEAEAKLIAWFRSQNIDTPEALVFMGSTIEQIIRRLPQASRASVFKQMTDGLRETVGRHL